MHCEHTVTANAMRYTYLREYAQVKNDERKVLMETCRPVSLAIRFFMCLENAPLEYGRPFEF